MLETEPLDYVPTIIMVNDDVFQWECSIIGPKDSPYAGGLFILKLEFPAQYPFKPPKLQFKTKIYHPSVQTESGDVCADVVGQWGPTLNAKHCLQVVYSMLQSPESDHPLEESIAKQLRDKPNEFMKMAKKFTSEHAK